MSPFKSTFYAPFAFIVSCLDRLSFRWKFATVAVVFVVAAAGFLHQIYAHFRVQAVEADRAIGGLGLVRDSLALMIELQLERGLTFTARKGGDDFTARLPQQKAAARSGIERVEAALARLDSLRAMHPRWASVRAGIERAILSTEDQSSAQSSFDTHTAAVNELLAWIVDIGDEAGITATSNPALYHLNLAQIRSLPGLVESLANLRGYATGTLLAGSRDAGITSELAGRVSAVDIAEGYTHNRIDRISRLLPDSLHMDDPVVRELHDAIRYVRNTTRSSTYLSPAPVEAADLFDVATQAIDAARRLHVDHLYPRSVAMIEAGLADVRRAMIADVLVLMSFFVIISTLFAAIYTSIRRSVNTINEGSALFAAGDLSIRVQVQSQDEFRHLGEQFNAMADEIASLVDAQRAQAQRLSGLLRNTPSVVFALDPHTLNCTFISPNAEALLGPAGHADPPDLEHLLGSIHPKDRATLRDGLLAWRERGFVGLLSGTYRLAHDDAGQKWVKLHHNAVLDDAGTVIEIVGSCTDITELHHAHTQLELAASVFSGAREGIIITDPQGCIVEANAACSDITGWSRDELLGENPRLFKSGRHNPAFYEAMWRSVKDNGYWEGEIWNRHKSGRDYAELLTIGTVRSPSGEVLHHVGLFSDITPQKEAEERLRKLAHFDPLTGLPNRTLLGDRMEQALLQSRRSSKLVAVALIDLDGFKAVNDLHGHDAGDVLLKTVSQRMTESLRAEDTVARLGGDEFVVVMSALDSRSDIEQPIARLLAAINQPVALDNATVKVSGSIGVTFYPQREPIAPDQLMRQADQAMYAAKQTGKNRWHVFDDNQGGVS